LEDGYRSELKEGKLVDMGLEKVNDFLELKAEDYPI